MPSTKSGRATPEDQAFWWRSGNPLEERPHRVERFAFRRVVTWESVFEQLLRSWIRRKFLAEGDDVPGGTPTDELIQERQGGGMNLLPGHLASLCPPRRTVS